jgi:hypothetical protein
MHSPRLFCLAHICAISIIATGAVSAQSPPTVEKSFLPNPIIQGLSGTMTITLTNPNSDPTPLTATVGDDVMVPPNGCLDFTSLDPKSITYNPLGCGSGDINSGLLGGIYTQAILTASLGGGASCSATFTVVATSFPCTNTTLPPHFSGGPDGVAAEATWTAITPNVSTFTEGGNSADMKTAANWSPTLPGSGYNAVFPEGLLFKGITNGATGTTLNSLIVNGAGLVFSGNAITVNAGVVMNASGGTATIGFGLTQSQDTTIQVLNGSLSITGPFDLNGHDLVILGPGPTFAGGSLGGTFNGPGNILVIYATVTVLTPPTFGSSVVTTSAPSTLSGAWYIPSGEVIFATPGPQPINVSGSGKVSGSTGTYGPITLTDQGIAELGSANAPATWSTAGAFSADPETEVIFNFGSNNTSHSEISSSTTVTFVGSSLMKGAFVATPTAGLTYGPLVLAGTLTGCPGDAVGCGPNGAMYEAMPVCFLNEVEFKVTHTDTIFKASLENPYEGCP